MKDVTKIIRSNFDGIIAWVQICQASEFLKAINGLFQSAKRVAHGYGRFYIIRAFVLLTISKLDFRNAIQSWCANPLKIQKSQISQ